MTSKMVLVFVAFCVMSVSAAEVADISFSSDWDLGSGAEMSGDTLILTSNSPGMRTASITVPNLPASANGKTLYFVADIYLTDVTLGSDPWKCPRMYLRNGANDNAISSSNMNGKIADKWFFTGASSEINGVTSLTCEFLMQQCTGTMKIVNPRLLDEDPVQEFIFPFDVPADRACRIDLESDGMRPFPEHLLSANTHFTWNSGSWGDLGVRDIVKTRYPLGCLRFPGGTVGKSYNWQTDLNDDGMGNPYGFEDFASLCIETGATANLMFNVLHDDVATSTARLRDRVNSGIDIGWIEMGNENYYTHGVMGNVNTVEEYVAHTKSLATSLRAVDPNIPLAINITTSMGEGSWNSHFFGHNRYFDAAVDHLYLGGNSSGMLCESASAAVFVSYLHAKDRFELYDSYFPDLPLILSEWGVIMTAPKNFASVLSSADFYLGILEGNDMGIVQLMGRHMMYLADHHNVSSAYYRRNGVMYRTSMGVVDEMILQFFDGSELYNAVGKSDDVVEGVPGILARAIEKDGQTQILVVNKLPEAGTLAITLDGENVNAEYDIEYFSLPIMGDTLGYPLTEDPLERNSGSGVVSVPAYSVSVVTLKESVPVVAMPQSSSADVMNFSQIQGNLVVTSLEEGSIQIFNTQGRMVREVSHFDNTISIDDLSRGVYLMKFVSQAGSSVHKISLF